MTNFWVYVAGVFWVVIVVTVFVAIVAVDRHDAARARVSGRNIEYLIATGHKPEGAAFDQDGYLVLGGRK